MERKYNQKNEKNCRKRVHQIGERVFHLLRGEVYEIFGSYYFTFGGARSVSGYVEGIEDVDWWKGEEPLPGQTFVLFSER